MTRFILYNLIFIPAFILYLPVFIKKSISRGLKTGNIFERFGVYSSGKERQLGSLERPIWVHAVSVGETVAALNFICRWQTRDSSAKFVLSCTTHTGHALAKKKAPEGVVVIFSPIDFCVFVRSAVKIINPSILVIFEVEIWPNLIMYTKKAGAKLALVNCRMSDSSSRGYLKFKWFFKPLFESFDTICTQSEEDTRRVMNVTGKTDGLLTCSTMKFDQVSAISSKDNSGLIQDVFGDHGLIFTAASTHSGEESMALDIFKELKKSDKKLKLILAPRHCERAGEIERILKKYPFNYSKLKTDNTKYNADILLINTTGELMEFLAVSDIVYVGKSMCGNQGGHNIIEPAIFGKVIIHGKEMQNFRRVVSIFQKENASIQVENKSEFMNTMKKLLANNCFREGFGQRSKDLVSRHQGAIDKTIDCLI